MSGYTKRRLAVKGDLRTGGAIRLDLTVEFSEQMFEHVLQHGLHSLRTALDRSHALTGLPLLDTIEETELTLTFGSNQHLKVSITRYDEVLPQATLQSFHEKLWRAVRQLVENDGTWLHPHPGFRYENRIETTMKSGSAYANLEMTVPNDVTAERLHRFYSQAMRYVNNTMGGESHRPFELFVMERATPPQLALEGMVAGVNSSQALQGVRQLVEFATGLQDK